MIRQVTEVWLSFSECLVSSVAPTQFSSLALQLPCCAPALSGNATGISNSWVASFHNYALNSPRLQSRQLNADYIAALIYVCSKKAFEQAFAIMFTACWLLLLRSQSWLQFASPGPSVDATPPPSPPSPLPPSPLPHQQHHVPVCQCRRRSGC